jgi:hypothetical protein
VKQKNTMTGIRSSWKRELAILIAVLLTVILYFLIPAISPGFPKPVVTHIYYSNSSTPEGGHIFNFDGRITNEGTRGNVIVTAELVNATNSTALTRSSQTVFMLEGEQKTVQMHLTGSAAEPYEIRFTAQRR